MVLYTYENIRLTLYDIISYEDVKRKSNKLFKLLISQIFIFANPLLR